MKQNTPATSSPSASFRFGLIGLHLLLALLTRSTKTSTDFDRQVALAYDRAMRS